MSDKTKIAWTDATWNPIRARDSAGTTGWHCERVSPGCVACYAETINEKRFGTGLPYNRKSRDLVEVYLDEKALTQPMHWRRPRKVFVCSMTDLFGEWVPDEMIDRVFAVMALSPQHTFQVLTKRPERMREYMLSWWQPTPEAGSDRLVRAMVGVITGRPRSLIPALKAALDAFDQWPLPNVWLGVSVEDQSRADQRIPELLATPAAVRFLSCEPLLGPVDLTRVQPSWLPKNRHSNDPIMRLDALQGLVTGIDEYLDRDEQGRHRNLDWVIVGGESGPDARPCDVEWIRGIVRQCRVAGTAVFVKQTGKRVMGRPEREPYLSRWILSDGSEWVPPVIGNHAVPEDAIGWIAAGKGGELAGIPEDLRVREFPEAQHE